MLASTATVDMATVADEYAFVEKLDGVCSLAAIDRDDIRPRERSGRAIDQYRDLVPSASYRAGVALDGEIVARRRKPDWMVELGRAPTHPAGTALLVTVTNCLRGATAA